MNLDRTLDVDHRVDVNQSVDTDQPGDPDQSTGEPEPAGYPRGEPASHPRGEPPGQQRPLDPWLELERRPAPPLTAATLVLTPSRRVHPSPTQPWPTDPDLGDPDLGDSRPAEPRPIQPFAPAGGTTNPDSTGPDSAKVTRSRLFPIAIIAIPVIVILLAAGIFRLDQGAGSTAASSSLLATTPPPSSPATADAGVGEDSTTDDGTSDDENVAVGTGPQAAYPCSGGATAGADLLAIGSTPPSGVEPYRQWWRNTEQVENLTFGDRSWRATVRAGSVNLWDLLVVHSCLPVQSGRTYSLAFTASAGTAVTVRARVQDRNPPDYTASLQQDVLVGPEPQRWTMPFTGALTSEASELSFQIGGNPDAEIRVSDIVLVATSP